MPKYRENVSKVSKKNPYNIYFGRVAKKHCFESSKNLQSCLIQCEMLEQSRENVEGVVFLIYLMK